MKERRIHPKVPREDVRVTSIRVEDAHSPDAAAHFAWNDSCLNHRSMETLTHPAEFKALKRAGRRGDRKTLCEVIMKTQVHYVSPEDSALNAARRMRERNVGFLPVCDSGGKILGTLTDRDIVLRLVADDLPASTRIGQIMSLDPVCCGAQDEIARAQELMARNRKSRILCVDEAGRLEGIISLSDLARNAPIPSP